MSRLELLEKLKEEIELWKPYAPSLLHTKAVDAIESLQAELIAATRERDDLKLDAQRYRWLRENSFSKVDMQVGDATFIQEHHHGPSSAEEVDRQVDEAIAQDAVTADQEKKA